MYYLSNLLSHWDFTILLQFGTTELYNEMEEINNTTKKAFIFYINKNY